MQDDYGYLEESATSLTELRKLDAMRTGAKELKSIGQEMFALSRLPRSGNLSRTGKAINRLQKVKRMETGLDARLKDAGAAADKHIANVRQSLDTRYLRSRVPSAPTPNSPLASLHRRGSAIGDPVYDLSRSQKNDSLKRIMSGGQEPFSGAANRGKIDEKFWGRRMPAGKRPVTVSSSSGLNYSRPKEPPQYAPLVMAT